MLCVIDIFSKYTWVIPIKRTKGITITNAFQKRLDEYRCKSNKQEHILTLIKKIMSKILNLIFVIMLESQNIKTFL